MLDSFPTAILLGFACGTVNGALTRWTLKKTLSSPDTVFYSVFAAGLLYRLCFLIGSVWLLRREKYIIVVSFTVSLILVQLVFEVVPIGDNNGAKRDS